MHKILPAAKNVFSGTNYVNFLDIMIYLNSEVSRILVETRIKMCYLAVPCTVAI